MAQFPKLKTQAIAQYPAATQLAFRTDVVRFVDGSDQRFRRWGGPVRSWTIVLDQLDEGEVHALRRFFEAHAGRAGTFSFMDPWTETEYERCAFDTDELPLRFSEIQSSSATIRIREVKE